MTYMTTNKTPKDLKALLRSIRRDDGWTGWTSKDTRKGIMIYPADKAHDPITIHKTPSDHRAWANTVAHLRRAGAPI